MRIFVPRKTEKYQIVVGTVPGYGENLENADYISEDKFKKVLYRLQNEVKNERGIFVSVNMWPSSVMYNQEWGCPINGESVYVLECARNPKYDSDSAAQLYKLCVLCLADKLMEAFDQCTVSVTASIVDHYYLTNKKGQDK